MTRLRFVFRQEHSPFTIRSTTYVSPSLKLDFSFVKSDLLALLTFLPEGIYDINNAIDNRDGAVTVKREQMPPGPTVTPELTAPSDTCERERVFYGGTVTKVL
jgi:hypothetical protein